MTRALGAAILLLTGTAALAQEGGSPHEAVVKEMIGIMERMTASLTGVKDDATAEAARPELKKAAEQFAAVRKKAEKLDQPTPEERKKITAAYQKKLAEVVARLKQEVARVQTVPGGRDALREIAQVFGKGKGAAGPDDKKK
jgi:hypothetical protein